MKKVFAMITLVLIVSNLSFSQISYDSILNYEIKKYENFRLFNSKNIDIRYSESIKKRLDDHKKWLESNYTEGHRFIAINENLSGFDFSHRELRQAQFIDCNLKFTSFRDSRFGAGSDFIKCRFYYSSFINADLTNVKFQESEICRTSFMSANFTNASIAGKFIELGQDTLFNSYFNANFTNATFVNTNFKFCDFENVTICNTQFIECNLYLIDFYKTKINSSLIISKSILDYAKFSKLFIPGSVFESCRCIYTEFRNSDLSGSRFNNCDLRSSSFSLAGLKGSLISESNCEASNFNGAILTESEARLNNFKSVDFRNARLDNADLSGSNLFNAQIDNTTNRNLTNFSGSIWINGHTCKSQSIGMCIEIQ